MFTKLRPRPTEGLTAKEKARLAFLRKQRNPYRAMTNIELADEVRRRGEYRLPGDLLFEVIIRLDPDRLNRMFEES